MTLARSVLESALHFPAIDTGAGGTGAGGGGASRLSGSTGRAGAGGTGAGGGGTSCLSARPLVRSGAGGPDGSLAGCSEGGHPTFRPVSSEKRGTTGSHLEHQLLGSRGPPTALTSRTSSSCSTTRDWPAELAGGGARGSEASIASLEDDGEEEAAQEPSDNKSDVAAVLAAVRVSVNLFCSVYQLRSGNHI